MRPQSIAILLALGLAGAQLALLWAAGPERSGRREAVPTPAAPLSPVALAPPPPAAAPELRRTAERPTPQASVPRPAAPQGRPREVREATWIIAGRVTDLRGQGLALDLSTGAGRGAGRSAGDGSFLFDTLPVRGTLRSLDPAWVVVDSTEIGPDTWREPQQVVATQSTTLAVSVVESDDQRPIPRARVIVVADPAAAAAPGFERRGETGESGEWQLADLPRGLPLELRVLTGDGRETRTALTVHHPSRERIAIPSVPRATLAGRVLGADGRPSAGAKLWIAGTAHPVGIDGRFDLRLELGAEAPAVHAQAAARAAGASASPDDLLRAGWPEARGLELRLGPADRRARGRLLDAAGAPVAGYGVVAIGPDHAAFGGTATDERGEFELVGWSAAEHLDLELRAKPVDFRLRLEAFPLDAPAPLEVRLPQEPVVGPLAVRIVSAGGAPLPGAGLHLVDYFAPIPAVPYRLWLAAEDGSLSLEQFPAEEAQFSVVAPGFAPRRLSSAELRAALQRREPLTIELTRE